MKGAKKGVTRKAASREIMRGDASDGHVSGLVLVVAVAAEAAVVVLAVGVVAAVAVTTPPPLLLP